MSEKYHIELTDEEQALVDLIDFDTYDRETHLANWEPIISLMKSLESRGGIPEARWRYWSDPEYYVGGRGKSRLDIFKKNGRTDDIDEIYDHPHFKKHLHYFLYGNGLPDYVVETLENMVADEGLNPKYMTSGDCGPLCKIARKVTRQYGLHQGYSLDAPDEFYKLCFDMGFDVPDAVMVRNTVKRVR